MRIRSGQGFGSHAKMKPIFAPCIDPLCRRSGSGLAERKQCHGCLYICEHTSMKRDKPPKHCHHFRRAARYVVYIAQAVSVSPRSTAVSGRQFCCTFLSSSLKMVRNWCSIFAQETESVSLPHPSTRQQRKSILF